MAQKRAPTAIYCPESARSLGKFTCDRNRGLMGSTKGRGICDREDIYPSQRALSFWEVG